MPTRVAKATDSFNSHWEAHVMTKENNITLWVLIGYYRKHSFTNTQQNTWCLHLSFKRIISWLFFSPPFLIFFFNRIQNTRKNKTEIQIRLEWSSDDLHTRISLHYLALLCVHVCHCVCLCIHACTCACLNWTLPAMSGSACYTPCSPLHSTHTAERLIPLAGCCYCKNKPVLYRLQLVL